MITNTPAAMRHRSPWWELTAFAAASYAILWGVAAAIAVLGIAVTGTGSAWALAGIWAPTLAGVLLTALFDGPSGLRELVGRALSWRVGTRWFAVPLLLVPALVLAFPVAGALADGHTVPLPTAAGWLTITVLAAVQGPLGEEFGWRGFALPRLLERMAPFWASVLLGIVWGVWHLPGFWLGVPPYDTYPFGGLVLGCVGMSLLMTWVHRGTGGSLLLAGLLMHAGMNAAHAYVGEYGLQIHLVPGALLLVAVGLAVVVRGPSWWFGRPRPVPTVIGREV
jgi:hypothetical protein